MWEQRIEEDTIDVEENQAEFRSWEVGTRASGNMPFRSRGQRAKIARATNMTKMNHLKQGQPDSMLVPGVANPLMSIQPAVLRTRGLNHAALIRRLSAKYAQWPVFSGAFLHPPVPRAPSGIGDPTIVVAEQYFCFEISRTSSADVDQAPRFFYRGQENKWSVPAPKIAIHIAIKTFHPSNKEP